MTRHQAALIIILWAIPIAITLYACIDWKDPPE